MGADGKFVVYHEELAFEQFTPKPLSQPHLVNFPLASHEIYIRFSQPDADL
jgi:hypothetical protein